jgi:hypothetical protein
MSPKYEVIPKKTGCRRVNWITVNINIMMVTIRLFLLLRIQYTLITFINLSTMVYVQYLVVNYSPDSHPSPDIAYPTHPPLKEKMGITRLELSAYFPLLKKGEQGGYYPINPSQSPFKKGRAPIPPL